MLSFQRLARSSESLFRALVGMGRKEFEDLHVAFSQEVERNRHEQEVRSDRQRAPGGGGTPLLAGSREMLLFILVYVKQYPTQDLQGILFGATQPWVCKWVHRLMPFLEGALGAKQHLPLRQTSSMEELRARCPDLEFIIDGTERPTGRPTKEPEQRAQYSGKKKRHTNKNILVTSKKTKKVIVLTPTDVGSKHDKKMTDENKLEFPPGSRMLQDSGFQGFAPEGVAVRQPMKKPRKQELTPEQKASNREISRDRIGVEHSIGGIKISRIVREVFRNRRNGFADLAMLVAAGLHNQRMELRNMLPA